MLMMLALRLTHRRTVTLFWGSKARRSERGGKGIQLTLMMLALRLTESIQSLGELLHPSGAQRPGDRRERRKGNPADADDSRVDSFNTLTSPTTLKSDGVGHML